MAMLASLCAANCVRLEVSKKYVTYETNHVAFTPEPSYVEAGHFVCESAQHMYGMSMNVYASNIFFVWGGAILF